MLELVATQASVVGCFAAPEALDALEGSEGVFPCRVAPDEIMLVGEAGSAEEIVRAAAARATPVDRDAVVMDASDGWSVWTLAGDTAREAFARLSEVPLPAEGFTQGDVAHIPVKVVALADHVHLLVPAMWGAYLRERILDLGLHGRERSEPAAWTVPAEGGRTR